MLICGGNRMSTLAVCMEAAPQFLLKADEAMQLIARQIGLIRAHWDSVCLEAALPEAEQRRMTGRQFLNPFAFTDAPDQLRTLGEEG